MTTIPIAVTEPSQVGAARREALRQAQQLGFDETRAGNVAIVVTEMASNLAKHAVDGRVLLRGLDGGAVAGLEVLALDKGPGMANVGACLRDGYSTGGTPGTGLGAVTRLAAEFDIYSLPKVGSALIARLWARPLPRKLLPAPLEFGVVGVPFPGEEVNGDAWLVEQEVDRSLVMVVDGLGHGAGAAEAARETVRIARANRQCPPMQIVELAHAALRGTRGAALAVAEVRRAAASIKFCGVGNISATVFADANSQGLVSHNGTAGYSIRKLQEFACPFPRDGLLVMHSDGLTSHWTLDRYPGLAVRHPGLIAGVLYRDCSRPRDDATVLVARAAPRAAE